jgi:predicted nucleic acid-binding protein
VWASRAACTFTDRFGIETIPVDMAPAQRAAAVRVRMKLKLPDAHAIATAIHAERLWGEDVRVESFDRKVIKAFETLRGSASD